MAVKVYIKEQIVEPLRNKGWKVIIDEADRTILYLTSPTGEFSESIKFYFKSVTEQSRDQGVRRKLRLQVSKFNLNSNGEDALIGWSEEFKVFVAWNASIHSNHGDSAMLSCYEDILTKASEDGFADGLRWNRALGREEKYIAFEPEFLEQYLLSLTDIFEIPVGDTELDESEDDEDEFEEEADNSLDEDSDVGTHEEFFERGERKRFVTEKIRDYKFRKKLLEIYTSGCAICGTKFQEILQGAHVVPVSNEGTDHQNNGILLCANHHLMFDRNLIVISEDFTVHVAELVKDEYWYTSLVEDNGGKIYLPISNQPSKENLRRRIELSGVVL